MSCLRDHAMAKSGASKQPALPRGSPRHRPSNVDPHQYSQGAVSLRCRNPKGEPAMIGITLTTDQIRSAPKEVRQWIEHQVIASLGLASEAPAPVQATHLAV